MRNISRDIKPIGVIKCRYRCESVSIYGLLLLIFNSRSRKMLRYAAVAGCNPSIYETEIDLQWFAFEKELYSRRLRDGSLREITQRIEQSVLLRVQEQDIDNFYRGWEEADIAGLSEVIKTQLEEVVKYDTGENHEVFVEIEAQTLNQRQFRYLTDAEKIMDEFKLHLEEEQAYSSLVALDIELERGKEHGPLIRVEDIEAGDMVYTRIVDTRDIGVYLSYLLGARKDEEVFPLSASVEDVKDTDEGVEVIVRYGPAIVGRAIEDPKKKVGIIRNPVARSYGWWYLIVALGFLFLYYFLIIK